MIHRIALTPGDPEGIGPEIAAKVCSNPAILARAEIILLGDRHAIRSAFETHGDSRFLVDLSTIGESLRPGTCGLFDPYDEEDNVDPAPEIAAIRSAVAGCQNGMFKAMVTGPIDKAKLMALGFPYPGHTNFLSALTGAPRPVMTFISQGLRVSLVTDHVPLKDVPTVVTREAILQTIQIAQADLIRWYGMENPRIAVCGLNPHAGELGRLGSEDQDVVAPAIYDAQALGILASGPHPSDTVFAKARAGDFDLVIALYHDQGLIPIKLLGLGAAVHLTFGLPILRTSVDHGTAKDIAHQGIANPEGLRAALVEAIRLQNPLRSHPPLPSS